MRRVVALGLVLAGLLGAPVAALAGAAAGPTVLSIPHNGPSVLAVPYNGRPSVLGVPPRQDAPAFQGSQPVYVAPHPHPVWVQPQWWWDGWQWVWVPGYWTR